MNFYQQAEKRQLFGAHRGFRALRPENTLASFESAVGHFDFIELDIQPDKDGALMVFHDETMERTTDVDTRVPLPRPHRLFHYDKTLLKTLDSASWFAEQDPFGTIASGIVTLESLSPQPVPTLEEVLLLCIQHAMPLNIEIKDSPTADTETLLIDLLKALAPWREHSIPLLISSFNHRYLARLHELDTTLDLAANVEHTHPSRLIHYLRDLGVVGYHVDAPLIRSTPVAELSEIGIACGAFTLNDPEKQMACFKQGFRAVFADMTNDTYRELQKRSS
jgi:glycerophosphoryl diester phosphodiesterase